MTLPTPTGPKSVAQALAAMDKRAVPRDCITDVLYDTASRSWTAMWIRQTGADKYAPTNYLNGSGRTPEQAILSLLENNRGQR